MKSYLPIWLFLLLFGCKKGEDIAVIIPAPPLSSGINVRDYGAVGNGIQDDTQAFEKAMQVADSLKQPVIVPVGKYAQAAVAAYLVRVRPTLATLSRGTPALFLNQRGSRLSRQSIWQIISNAALAAKLGVEVSPHTFRHSFATHLLEGGADVRVVQELLGHASVTTTQIYTLVTVDALREIYASSHPRAQR